MLILINDTHNTGKQYNLMTAGFTLIELSILIVTISLIVTGIVAGKSLVQASQVRTVISEVEIYKTAVNSFKDIYGALPGDYQHADNAWSCGVQCNGDGNGFIDRDIGWKLGMLEGLRAWQHLELAKLLPNSYTGVEQGGEVVPGTNAPKSSLDGGAYIFGYEQLGIENIFDRPGNYLTFGSAAMTTLAGPALPIASSYSIDHKIDDGKATRGGIRARTGHGSGWALVDPVCVDNSGGKVDYNFDGSEGKSCIMHFWLI